ncbi:ABC transporter ATP-binding protein [Sporanaerobacter acetigenes]|uniref:ATP-binding cassette, subfamily B n=1 Tax=Sporanaerobacter acetigenes DSM 13106 TaxID=1123281 RepID=A0A1M5Z6S4_9FIRM|nr:ABC transporter ATP-binding protein [Sporanaerobacter acetigenes]SHI19957.1 ATP-binding cassette, subfamily B [Sporanaerobacter acetigenes DSM 13106]
MKTYKKLLSYVPRQKYLSVIAICFSVLSACLTVGSYYFIYGFLNKLLVQGDTLQAKKYAIITTGMLIIGALLYLGSGYFSHVLGFRLETNLRKRGIDGLADASFRFFDLYPSGLTRKIIDDNAQQTHMIIAHLIPDSSLAMLMPILAIALGFVVSLRVGIMLLVLTLLGIVILFSMMGEQKFMEIYQKSLEKLSAETVEYVRGMQVIKIFGANVHSFKALHKAITDYAKYAYEYSQSCKKPYVWFQWFFFGIMAILIPLILIFIDINIDPNFLVVELIMTFFLSGVLFVSFMRIMYVSMYKFQGNNAADKLEELFSNMQKDKLEFGTEEKFKDFNIEFENVSFGYNEEMIIKDLSFKLDEGKSYALVGSSGSGKSTIAKLIYGFYKVDNGAIKIGDKPLENYTQKALIETIAFVFQDAKLFNKSIYENVKLAKKDATKEEVLYALHLAGCDSILDKFRTRENTIIGSKGVYLSGGEKQRIAIARAILKDAKIVIMDEASAAVDPENEHELQLAFSNLMKGKTVIMIAHRMTSIRNVDEILVLEDGKIIERGTDRELMNKNGKYRDFQNLYGVANEWRVGYEEVL